MSLKNIYFILVRPQIGENVGSVARALKNFNITKLRIVSPRCNWPNQKALATSVGAKDILNSCKIYNSIEKSVGDLDVIFASTSRIRKVNKRIISILDLKKKVKVKQKIGIMFGSEASGLSNNEISYANYALQIPTNPNFKSLNLSHSVIIISQVVYNLINLKKLKYTKSKKVKLAIDNGLSIMFCIGEKLEEREAGTTTSVCKK